MEQDDRCGGTEVAVSQAGHNGIGHMSLNLRHVQEPTTAKPPLHERVRGLYGDRRRRIFMIMRIGCFRKQKVTVSLSRRPLVLISVLERQ